MKTIVMSAAALAMAVLASPAFASNGGDRTAAGGAFMSSYSNAPTAAESRQGPRSWDGSYMSEPRDVGATGSLPRHRYDGRR